jgi:hypothetical protein
MQIDSAREQMNAEGLREQIKWWDALDTLIGARGPSRYAEGVEMARECEHPDAVWLASLFPGGATVTRQTVVKAVQELQEDPRAVYIAWMLAYRPEGSLCPAAETGYPPAQAQMAAECEDGAEALAWAEKAAASGDRCGLYRLGRIWHTGRGCVADEQKALELYRRAAELGDGMAQYAYGMSAFDNPDPERYRWLGRASLRGFGQWYMAAVIDLLPSFKTGELGRVLQVVGPVLRELLDKQRDKPEVFGELLEEQLDMLRRIAALHAAMLERARHAILCWGVVGLRAGLVKDMRVMIANMLWEHAWTWSKKHKKNRS